jgi:hypothetical protein
MISKSIEKVLREILDPGVLAENLSNSRSLKPPDLKEMKEVAKLIDKGSSEESFQTVFSRNPHFLFRAAPSAGGNNLGLLIKPPVSTFFNADYAIFSVGQGGCAINLIELENPADKIFTGSLTPASKLQTAIGHIDDWNQWLDQNRSTFAGDGLTLLKSMPEYPNKTKNGGFKCTSNVHIMKAWNAFGSLDSYYVSNLIVLGRWSRLSEKERKRLIYYNDKFRPVNLQIRTYDQLIRRGYDGPPMYW